MEGKICPSCRFENNWEAYECFQCKKRLGFRKDQKDHEKMKVAVIVLYLIAATGALFSFLNFDLLVEYPQNLKLYYPVLSFVFFLTMAILAKKFKFTALLWGFIVYDSILLLHFLNIIRIKFIPSIVLAGFAVLLFMGLESAYRNRVQALKGREDILDD